MYRSRKSPRHPFYDYRNDASYFITICTKNRVHYFGEVVDGHMILNDLGKYVTDHWQGIPDHYPFVEVADFVCMPNHIHGVLTIEKGVVTSRSSISVSCGIQAQSGSLGSIIRGYKIGITKYAKKMNFSFAWQARYHDHIIRNQESYDRICFYIKDNPRRWKEDCFYC